MRVVSAMVLISQSLIVPFMPSLRFFTASWNERACTSMVLADFFSRPDFSSRVMNITLQRYHLSPSGSWKSSEMRAFFTAVTSNSPLMNGVISSMMRASASVKVIASTRYASVTFFCVPVSSVFSYFTLHSNQLFIAIS